MAAEISSIGMAAQLAAIQQTESNVSRSGSSPVTLPTEPTVGLRAGVAGSRPLQGEYARAQADRDQRLDQALAVNRTQKVLVQAEALIAQAEEPLGVIVKRYPPYGQDSPERIELLNRVTGLRKQIEALTFPPETTQEANQLDPVLKKLAGLAVGTSDKDLATLLNDMETARALIAERRGAMWPDSFEQGASEQEAAIRASASRAALANMAMPLTQSPGLLTDLV